MAAGMIRRPGFEMDHTLGKGIGAVFPGTRGAGLNGQSHARVGSDELTNRYETRIPKASASVLRPVSPALPVARACFA